MPSILNLICPLALLGCGAAPSRELVDSTRATAVPAQRPASGHDWTRFGWDVTRSNVATDETGITASSIGTMRRQQVALDGTVDASPIYLHGVRVNGATRDVFFVTTSYGKTLAIDASDGRILWRYTPPGYDSWAGTSQITTATPVADPGREFIYAAAPDGKIRKLAVADGRPVWTTAITKLPQREKIASSLNFFRGRVIATTGGYIGDAPPYQGHVAILDAASGGLLRVWNSLCSDRLALIDPPSCPETMSAIWGRAGAVVDTTTGDIYVATGNGRWDGRTYWGDAVIVIDSSATKILDNYTPTNTDELNARDADLGSTSPVLLGGGYVLQGGKDGLLRVMRIDRARGATPRKGGETQIVKTRSGEDLFTAPAVRRGTPTWIFVADNRGTGAWTFTNGRLREMWKNGNAGTSPVLAGGLLYIYDPGGDLRVYEPESGRQIATLDAGGGHWNSPIIVDGRIALAEGSSNSRRTSGVLNIWRLP